jgi:hypothetical protein
MGSGYSCSGASDISLSPVLLINSNKSYISKKNIMKKLLFITLVLIATYGAVNAQQEKKQQLLRHVVMFGWKEGTDAGYISKVVSAISNLQHKIPVIKAFEWGTNNSPENLSNGLTHCFVLTFSSESDRDAYLIHPDHKAFVALLNPAPDKITVFDYWASK